MNWEIGALFCIRLTGIRCMHLGLWRWAPACRNGTVSTPAHLRQMMVLCCVFPRWKIPRRVLSFFSSSPMS